MRTLSCPRCQSHVTIAEGQNPICPSCGFTDAAPEAPPAPLPAAPLPPAPAPPPAPVAAPAPAYSTAPPPRRSNAGLVVGVSLAILLLGVVIAAAVIGYDQGWFDSGDDDPGTASQDEALRFAAGAPGAFADSVSQGRDVRTLTMEMSGSEDQANVELEFMTEWGRNDVRHTSIDVQISFGGAGFFFVHEVYCKGDDARIVQDGVVYRPRLGTSDECDDDLFDEEPTDDLDGADDFLDELDAFTAFVDDGAALVDVDVAADGTIDVTYIADGTTFDAVLDASGRLISLEMADGGTRLTLEATYGDRRTLDFPAATATLAADISALPDFASDADSQAYDILATDEALPRADFEVWLLPASAEADDPKRSDAVATWNLGAPGADGVFTLAWVDAAGAIADIDTGDSFTISKTGADIEGDYQVILWDAVAEAPAGALAIPGPVPLLAGLALVGSAWARRRHDHAASSSGRIAS